MYVRKLLGPFAAAALITACGELPTEPPPLDADLLSAAADANPVIGSASGSGHAECAAGPLPQCFPGGGLRTFSFNALLYADGSVGGQAQFNNREVARQIKLDIQCLRFFGAAQNRAWMIGTVTHSSDPAEVGTVQGFAVEDNGEGGGAAADRITGVAPGPLFFTALICQGGDDGGLFDALFDGLFGFDAMQGNIQVRAP